MAAAASGSGSANCRCHAGYGACSCSSRSGIQTAKGGRGVGGSTFAHWQIGLAFANYLSHDFHMWANTAVRDRMREVHEVPRIAGNPADPATVLRVIQHLQAQIAAQGQRVAVLDRLEGAEGSRCITDTAKLLKMPLDALTRWMVANRWIFRRPGTETWVAYRDKEQALLVEHVPYHYTGRDGTPRVKMQVLITQGDRLKETDSGVAFCVIHRAPLSGEAFDVEQGAVGSFFGVGRSASELESGLSAP